MIDKDEKEKKRKNAIEDLKSLLRYHCQATHEFFDDAENDVLERASTLFQCLDKDELNVKEIKEMMGYLRAAQEDLKKRLSDLDYLIKRMSEILDRPILNGE